MLERATHLSEELGGGSLTVLSDADHDAVIGIARAALAALAAPPGSDSAGASVPP